MHSLKKVFKEGLIIIGKSKDWKKNLVNNLFLSTFIASGNFFSIKIVIILQMHLIE